MEIPEAVGRTLSPRRPNNPAANRQNSWCVQLTAIRQMLGALRSNLDAVMAILDVMATRPPASNPSAAPGNEWITAKESGLGVRHFRRAAKRGDIPAHRVGRQLVARRCDVDRYIEQQPVAAKPESILPRDPFDNALTNGKLTPLQKDT